MTGPEHYSTAEVLLATAQDDTVKPLFQVEILAAIAQTHATLALAAATALQADLTSGQVQVDREAWIAVAGPDTTATLHQIRRDSDSDQP